MRVVDVEADLVAEAARDEVGGLLARGGVGPEAEEVCRIVRPPLLVSGFEVLQVRLLVEAQRGAEDLAARDGQGVERLGLASERGG